MKTPGSASHRISTRRVAGVAAAAASLLLASLLAATASSCSSPRPRRIPVGETFPTVRGAALDGTPRELPRDLWGKPTVVLVGYEMNTQFDLDRWILGLAQAKAPARILEVPTIPGLVPTLLSGQIDSGMRAGIPSEDWASVVTVYGSEAARIAEFTGDEGPRNGRVLLLDSNGTVRWFHDRGYSATLLLRLLEALTAL